MTVNTPDKPAPLARDYAPPADLLAGRLVLITGAATGLGRGIAEAAAAASATLVLVDKDLRALEALHDRIEAAGHEQPILHPMNLEGAGPADHLELASELDRQFGRLDALVHNAAMLGELSPMEQYDAELWARTLHVNVNAPFLLNQALLPLLRRSDAGRILFVADRTGRRGHAFWGAYGVSKFAQEGMMETLADELGELAALRVMSIDPGPVNSALRRQAYPGEDCEALPQPDAVGPALLRPLGPDGARWQGARLSLEPRAGESNNQRDSGGVG